MFNCIIALITSYGFTFIQEIIIIKIQKKKKLTVM